MGDRHEDRAIGAMWREFGLRRALASMPSHSPGRAVIEALLAQGTLSPEDERRFKAQGLRTALANMPEDSPGRAVVERLLADESDMQPATRNEEIASESTTNPTGGHDLPEQLERLARLHEQGHLTDDEFESAKRKLLS